jgi:hypothetical protein
MLYKIKLTTELVVEQDAANEAEAIAQALQSVPQWLDWRADLLSAPPPAPLPTIAYTDRPPGLLDDEYDEAE